MATQHETMFADAMEALADQFGDSCVYHRGSSSVALTAIPSTRRYTVFDREGIATQMQAEDFQIETADLALSGTAITPQPGDRIKRTISGQVKVYELVPLGDRPCFEHRLGTGLTIIHTKLVGTE